MKSKNLSIIREELSKKIPDFRLVHELSKRDQMLIDYVARHLIDLGIRKQLLDDCHKNMIIFPSFESYTEIEETYLKAFGWRKRELKERWTSEMTQDILAFHGGGIEMNEVETSENVISICPYWERVSKEESVDSYDLREHRRGYSDGKNDCHANSPFEIRHDKWSFNGTVSGHIVKVRPDGNFWSTTPEPTRGTSPEYISGYREGYEETRESLRDSLRAEGW